MDDNSLQIDVYSPEKIREVLDHHVKRYLKYTSSTAIGDIVFDADAPGFVSKNERGAMIGKMNQAMMYILPEEDLEPKEQQEVYRIRRLLVMAFLFQDSNSPLDPLETSNVLGGAQWYAVKRWIGAWYDEVKQKWCPRPAWLFEIAQVYWRASLCYELCQPQEGPDGEYRLSLQQAMDMTRPYDYSDSITMDRDGLLGLGILMGAELVPDTM